MKYKVGDKVRIKNLDWYNENKDEYGTIIFSTESGDYSFIKEDTRFCGRVVTITYARNGHYFIAEDDRGYFWIDEMLEGLVEEETKNWADISIPDGPYTVTYGSPSMNDSMNKNNIDNGIIILPEGYIFKDENGNEILTSKIILEKKEKGVSEYSTH